MSVQQRDFTSFIKFFHIGFVAMSWMRTLIYGRTDTMTSLIHLGQNGSKACFYFSRATFGSIVAVTTSTQLPQPKKSFISARLTHKKVQL